MQKATCFFIFAVICSSFFKNAAYATSFGVSPVRIAFSNTQNIAAFEIKNQNEDILTLQLDLKSWTEQNNTENYSDTNKLLLTPRIVSIQPHKSQVIRIALRNPQRGSVEEDYRIFIREIVDRSQENKAHLNFVLEVNMPVFVLPNTKEVRNLEWKIENISNKTIRIIAHNKGNTHVLIKELDIVNKRTGNTVLKKEFMQYVLPLTEKSWNVETTELVDAGQLQVNVKPLYVSSEL